MTLELPYQMGIRRCVKLWRTCEYVVKNTGQEFTRFQFVFARFLAPIWRTIKQCSCYGLLSEELSWSTMFEFSGKSAIGILCTGSSCSYERGGSRNSSAFLSNMHLDFLIFFHLIVENKFLVPLHSIAGTFWNPFHIHHIAKLIWGPNYCLGVCRIFRESRSLLHTQYIIHFNPLVESKFFYHFSPNSIFRVRMEVPWMVICGELAIFVCFRRNAPLSNFVEMICGKFIVRPSFVGGKGERRGKGPSRIDCENLARLCLIPFLYGHGYKCTADAVSRNFLKFRNEWGLFHGLIAVTKSISHGYRFVAEINISFLFPAVP